MELVTEHWESSSRGRPRHVNRIARDVQLQVRVYDGLKLVAKASLGFAPKIHGNFISFRHGEGKKKEEGEEGQARRMNESPNNESLNDTRKSGKIIIIEQNCDEMKKG